MRDCERIRVDVVYAQAMNFPSQFLFTFWFFCFLFFWSDIFCNECELVASRYIDVLSSCVYDGILRFRALADFRNF